MRQSAVIRRRWPNSARANWLEIQELRAEARVTRPVAPPRREKSEADKLQSEIVSAVHALALHDRLEPLRHVRDYLQDIPLVEPLVDPGEEQPMSPTPDHSEDIPF